ncbi:MAG: CoA transferase, partial [Humibacillus sp.]|nr:CoA transferase [Humibacillus sp.]
AVHTVQAEHAAQAILRLSHAHAGRLLLVALGPLTNLAVALKLDAAPAVPHGPRGGRRDGGTSVDYLAQVRSGMPLITGHPDAEGRVGEPVNQVLPAWDVAAGLYLATGLVAAERHRVVTGVGQSIRVALDDVALSTLSTLGYYAEAHLNNVERAPIGNEVYGSLGRDVLTADGARLYLLVLTPRHWSDLLDLTGLGPRMAEIEREVGADFASESDRFTHRHRIFALLDPWFGARSWEEVSSGLARTKVLWAAYRSFRDVVALDAKVLRDDPMFHEVDQPGVGPLLRAGMPLTMGGRDAVPTPAPAVGQHTREVLTEVLGAPPASRQQPSRPA